jgi:hypothetical protein
MGEGDAFSPPLAPFFFTFAETFGFPLTISKGRLFSTSRLKGKS